MHGPPECSQCPPLAVRNKARMEVRLKKEKSLRQKVEAEKREVRGLWLQQCNSFALLLIGLSGTKPVPAL